MKYELKYLQINHEKITPTLSVLQLCNLSLAQLKTFYFIFYCVPRGDTKEDCAKLKLAEKEYIDALTYWNGLRYITVIFADEPVSTEKIKISAPYRHPREIYEVTKREDIKELLHLATTEYGSISRSMELLICNLIDYYGFDYEAAGFLLKFANEKPSKKPGELEKTFAEWATSGNTTLKDVEEKAEEYFDFKDYCSDILNYLEISYCSPLNDDYLKKWFDAGFDEELVQYAGEISIDNTKEHIVSFPYMEAVLKKWSEENIKTVDKAIEYSTKKR